MGQERNANSHERSMAKGKENKLEKGAKEFSSLQFLKIVLSCLLLLFIVGLLSLELSFPLGVTAIVFGAVCFYIWYG